MKGWKGWLLLSGLFYLFFLIWQLPADLCWRWGAKRLGPAVARINVVGISGAWSDGRLAVLQSGALQLTDLTWSFRPLGLLAGRLKFAVAAKLEGEAPIGASLSLTPKRLVLSRIHGQVPAALLSTTLLPGLGLSGNLESRDLELALTQGRLSAASGSLSWRDAGISFPNPVALGNLELHLNSEAGGITASLKDQSGPLSLNVLASIKPDGTYDLTGEIMPRGQMSPDLASMVKLFGRPAADGRIPLRRKGRLAPIF